MRAHERAASPPCWTHERGFAACERFVAAALPCVLDMRTLISCRWDTGGDGHCRIMADRLTVTFTEFSDHGFYGQKLGKAGLCADCRGKEGLCHACDESSRSKQHSPWYYTPQLFVLRFFSVTTDVVTPGLVPRIAR